MRPRWGNPCRAAALAAALVGLSSAPARAAYAPGCTVALDLAGATHVANAVALQADGKIVVAGYVNTGANRDFLVARFHPDLTLDTSFNGTGYRVDDLQGRDDEIYSLAIQFDQKIVVGGYSQNNPSKRFLAFARYHRDGTPDPGFATGGYFILDIFGGSPVEEIRGIALQPDGKIVGVGFDTPSSTRLFAMRLTKAGALDATFNGGTASPVLTGTTASLGRGVAIDANGGILVAGEANLTTKDFVLARLTPTGTLDPGFATNGWTSLDVSGSSVDSASSLVLQPDGKIVVAGTSNGNVAVARYLANGTLDPGFGGTGSIVQDLGGADAGSAVALDASGKIVVAGERSLPPADFAFARFVPSGGLDLSKTDDVSGLDDRARALAITRLGKLLLAGSSQGASPQLTLALYNPDGSQDCGSLFLHPTADAVSDFVSVGACGSHAACVNDQAGDASTGPPIAHDGLVTRVDSATASARELYRLADGLLPAGKVVTEIEVVAQLAWSGAGSSPTAEILYQRQGFDLSPVASSTRSISSTSFVEERFRASSLNWPAAELDALEIGVDHVSGNDLRLTQSYVKVTYGEPLVRPVQVLTAAASGGTTTGEVLLNWLNPSYGLYARTVIRRVPACPALPTDGVAVTSPSDGLGQPGAFVDSVPIGPTYHYAAFVEDAEGHASAGVCVDASPFDRTSSPVEWTYDTGISALTTPSLRIDLPGSKSTVYSIANDGLVHAIVGGPLATGGGRWPAGWKPFRLDDAAQSRPPVVPLPTSQLALLAGAQDGRVYAIDASTGSVIWKTAKLGADIQASPAVVLNAFGGGRDLVFAGTRNAGQPNRMYAIDATDGTVAWSFDNGGGASGIGMIVGGSSVDYAGKLYFTSALGASGNNVWCLDYLAASPPQPCWASFGVTTSGGGDISSSAILFAGSVFVSENAAGGDLRAVDPASGSDLLVHPLGGGGAKGYVFPRLGFLDVFASTSTTVWSIDTSTPGPNWSGSCVNNPSTPAPVPFTDFVFLGSNEGKLFQMSASAGSGCPSPPSVCIGDCTGTIVGAPAYDIVHAMLYSGTDEGRVYGVRTPFP